MGYGISLSDDQWDEIGRVRFSAGSAEVFRNCLIILYSHSRDTIEAIANRLGCSTDTVKRVRKLYRQGGAAALRPIKPPGRTGRATPQYLSQMRLAVQANPMDLGYGFSVWSAKRLAEHLAKVTGIRLSDDRLRKLLHQHGYSVHRPKHTLKGKRDEIEYNKAKRKLVRLKKTP